MKLDGRAIAHAMVEHKKRAELEKEGHEVEREQEEKGDHIVEMMSMIEAIHHKEPEKAHAHFSKLMSAYNKKD